MQQTEQNSVITDAVTTGQLIERQKAIIYKIQDSEFIENGETSDSSTESRGEDRLLKLWREILCLHKLIKIKNLEESPKSLFKKE